MQSRRHFIKSIAGTAAYLSIGGVGIDVFASGMPSGFTKLDRLMVKNQYRTLSGIPSGFTELDKITSGWQNSDLIIVAARPGMGKTAFAISLMLNASVDYGLPVAFFSLEMASNQLDNRLMSAQAELEGDKIRKGKLGDFEWLQFNEKIKPLTQAPIYIDDTPALSTMELREKCRRLKSKHDIRLIIVDYLQLMSADINTRSGTGKREQEIASLLRALKNLAKELDIPVIAFSQLSRPVEYRYNNRPKLADLRPIAAIEQNADLVIFLYRPEKYWITEDEYGNSTTGLVEVIIAKNRNGYTGHLTLRFIDKFSKFSNFDFNLSQYRNRISERAG